MPSGAHWRVLFDGMRFRSWPGVERDASHGGTRVVDLQQHKRSGEALLADIQRERAEHAPLIDEFHRLFYASHNTHGMTFYEGVPVLKNPLDLWVFQELIWDLRPTLIIETGTAYGGSALYFARQLDRVGEGKVVSIDLEPAEHLPQHPRVSYVKGWSSLAPAVVAHVAEAAASHPRVMVVLDSDHGKRHVAAELEAYAGLVSRLQFLVVEDTNINGRPVALDWKDVPGSGPGPAVDDWLPAHPEFERAVLAERYLLTHNPGGWLRRCA